MQAWCHDKIDPMVSRHNLCCITDSHIARGNIDTCMNIFGHFLSSISSNQFDMDFKRNYSDNKSKRGTKNTFIVI